MLSINEGIAKYDGKIMKISTNNRKKDLGEFYTAHIKTVKNGKIVTVDGIITDSVVDRFRELWVEAEGDGYNLTYIDKYAPTEYMRTNYKRYGFSDVDDDDGHFGYGHTTEGNQFADWDHVRTMVLLTPEFLVEHTRKVKKSREKFYASKGITPPSKKA